MGTMAIGHLLFNSREADFFAVQVDHTVVMNESLIKVSKNHYWQHTWQEIVPLSLLIWLLNGFVKLFVCHFIGIFIHGVLTIIPKRFRLHRDKYYYYSKRLSENLKNFECLLKVQTKRLTLNIDAVIHLNMSRVPINLLICSK